MLKGYVKELNKILPSSKRAYIKYVDHRAKCFMTQ